MSTSRLNMDAALAEILASVEALGVERIHIQDALGRVLAADVVADRDQPPFDRSAMDGFAVRSVDCASAPATLSVVCDIPAGSMQATVFRLFIVLFII